MSPGGAAPAEADPMEADPMEADPAAAHRVEADPAGADPAVAHPVAAAGAADAAGPAVRIGVLALQGDVREHVAALRSAGADTVEVRRAQDLVDLDGLVLPGGESTTMARLLAVFDVLEPLRALVRAGTPAYGSCAGMILLADEVSGGRPGQQTLGGLDVTVRRNAFGRQVDSFESEVEVEGLGPVHAVFIRAPWVERVGAAVEVLARVGEHPVAVRQGQLLATSFHPELTGDGRVHAMFVEMVRAHRAAGRVPTAP